MGKSIRWCFSTTRNFFMLRVDYCNIFLFGNEKSFLIYVIVQRTFNKSPFVDPLITEECFQYTKYFFAWSPIVTSPCTLNCFSKICIHLKEQGLKVKPVANLLVISYGAFDVHFSKNIGKSGDQFFRQMQFLRGLTQPGHPHFVQALFGPPLPDRQTDSG